MFVKNKPVYAKEKSTGEVHLVSKICFDLNSIVVSDTGIGDSLYKWLKIDEVELFQK